ncbi:MAG TPA: AAA-like domain-containing protein, partial [Polyangium sp.]|nr:AAA-like domain-containing protein [Polyangium sp.]
MRPSFNTAGPCLPDEHYMLPPERRLGEVMELIDERKFFTLHAGRQTGKTTSLMWLQEHLSASGKQRALWVDIQTAREKPDTAVVMTIILHALQNAMKAQFPNDARPTDVEIEAMLRVPDMAMADYLKKLAALDPRPLIVMLDEADALVGAAMVSFLTQLRDGYIQRSKVPFPSSVILVGQRQVRDYALAEEDRKTVSWLGTSSPFNINAEPKTLAPFTPAEVEELLTQHTITTGQRFEPEAIARIVDLGRGHPWLTNAMADQIVRRDVKNRSVPITADHVDAAKETIILERRTHIDS